MANRNQVLQAELQDEQMLAAIERALALLQRPGDLMEDIGATIEGNAELRFDAKVDPTGAAWAPLSPATVAIYESAWFIERNPAFKGGIPGTLLERTRQLRNSLAHNAGVDYVEIGTSRQVGKKQWQVGALHEWGTETMPRRGILTANPRTGELGAGDAADVLAIVNAALRQALG
jgi:phage gpG-like protein